MCVLVGNGWRCIGESRSSVGKKISTRTMEIDWPVASFLDPVREPRNGRFGYCVKRAVTYQIQGYSCLTLQMAGLVNEYRGCHSCLSLGVCKTSTKAGPATG